MPGQKRVWVREMTEPIDVIEQSYGSWFVGVEYEISYVHCVQALLMEMTVHTFICQSVTLTIE